MNYPQAIEFLGSLQQFGARFGLETTRELARRAGDPQAGLRFIHVAGTNGKGSTCAFIESLCRHAGLRTGLYTSPHLVRFGERVQVDRQRIFDADVARLVSGLRPHIEALLPVTPPTFFEAVTVLALQWFAEQRCDVVVWETGLGGRLDATNIVTPLASVITNIAADHQQWLGETLAQIAAEKAGIIKPRVPVLTAADAPDALAVITATAARLDAPLTVVGGAEAAGLPALPLHGAHQRLNAALALATLEVLRADIPATADALLRGLVATRWPGRVQVETLPDGRTLVLDGAHNPAGAAALRGALGELFPGRAPAFILATLRDKDWPALAATLAPVAGRCFTVPVTGSARGLPPEELAAACRAANPSAEARSCGSFAAAWEAARAEPLVVVTGSLHFIGEALEALGLEPGAGVERNLNEWTDADGARLPRRRE